MVATLTLKAAELTGDGAYYVKDDTVTFVLDSAADTEKTDAGTKVATWTKESNTLGIVADAAALTISSDADYTTGATISGLRATDTVTLKVRRPPSRRPTRTASTVSTMSDER